MIAKAAPVRGAFHAAAADAAREEVPDTDLPELLLLHAPKGVFRPPGRGERMRPHFSLSCKRKTVSPAKKRTLLRPCAVVLLCCVLGSAKEKRGRIDSASESTAAEPALEEVPSTNLPKKPLNQFDQKQYWQVCASATSRNARAAAVQEAGRSSTARFLFQNR